MKEFRLESFSDLDDAIMWLESQLFELELTEDYLKGELVRIGNSWRVAITIDDGQGELDV